MSYLSVKAKNGEIYQIKRLDALPKEIQKVILDYGVFGSGSVSYIYSAALMAIKSKKDADKFQALAWPIKRDFILEAGRLWKNDWLAQMSGEEPEIVY